MELVILEIIEPKHKLLKYFSKLISETRHDSYIKYDISKLLKQRIYMLIQGYEDANDVILESLQWNIPKIEQFYFRFIHLDFKEQTCVHSL